MSGRPRTTSFVEGSKNTNPNFGGMKISSKDGSKVSSLPSPNINKKRIKSGLLTKRYSRQIEKYPPRLMMAETFE